MSRFTRKHVAFLAVASGAVYGLIARLLFAKAFVVRGQSQGGALFGVMTFSFVFLVPLGIGFLTVWLAPYERATSWLYRLFMPWLTTVLAVLATVVGGMEGMICVVMLLPVALVMASIGGVAAGSMRVSQMTRWLSATAVFPILLLPYLVAPLEHRLGAPTSHREVANEIRIHADPATVWRNISRVPAIRSDEYRGGFVHWIGFPEPIEATLSHEGVGGVREASFARGVVFHETVTTWEPERLLAFTIKADPETIPPTALDRHVTVGGEFFDVLDGTYRIEPVAPGEVVLHLKSTHRLSTTFNAYASLWTDLVMSEIQGNILQVIKRRSESAQQPASRSGTTTAP
jgi:hypothetical protein